MESSPTDTPPGVPDPTPPRTLTIEITTRTIWVLIGAVLVTMGLLWAVSEARGLVSMVLIAFFFSLALEPGVQRLTARYGWRRGSATGVIYVAGFLFVGFMLVVLIPGIVELGKVIGDRGADWIADLNQWAEDTVGVTIAEPASLPGLAGEAGSSISSFGSQAFGTAVGLASGGLRLVFSLATIAMFTFYLTANAPAVRRAILRLFRPEIQERILWTWGQAIVQTGGYFYSRLVLMIINGLGFFLAMVIAGLPVRIGIPLSLFGGFVSVFITAIGTDIGGAVPALLALAVEGPAAGLIVIAYVLLYQQIENYWLGPKISANTMSLNGGIAFGAALGGGAIAGPMGAFTALPVAALISSFMSNYVASHEVTQELEPADGVEGSRRRRRNRGRTDTGTDGEATP